MPQTSDFFNRDLIKKSKCLKVYDINAIDYKYIESLYNLLIPQEIINYRGPHARSYNIKINKSFEDNVYDLDMKIYLDYNIPISKFYNDELKRKVYEYYKGDFLYFNENKITYGIS